MNLDELRSVQSKERQTDSLQHLRESFYEDVSAYVSELEDARDGAAEAAEDPFADAEVRQLTDEIETAREVVQAIYERRLGKLVKRASLAAADMPANEEGLTAEERELFEDLVARIRANKAHVLDVLDADDPGEASLATGSQAADATAAAPDAEATEGQPADTQTGPREAPEHGSAEPPADGGQLDGDAGAEPAGLDARTTVRITGDVDEFYGVDEREYDLDREDVVTLPAENAEPLLESGDAERLD
jgi:DNA replication factor GINS